VDDERISSRHAEVLITRDGRIQIREIDAGTGTFVNDERVQSYPLRHGDRLAFGPLIALLDTEEAPLPPPAKVDFVENSLKDALVTQEKRLLEAQSAADLAEAKHLALMAAIQGLLTEKDEKNAVLKGLDAAKEAASQALSDLSAQQEKDLARLNQLKAEVALVETRLTESQAAVATLSVQQEKASAQLKQISDAVALTQQHLVTLQSSCEQLETLAATHQSRVDGLETEIQAREQRSSQVQAATQAADGQLTELQAKSAEAEERSSHLITTLAALDEEHASLTELLTGIQEDIATQKAFLKEETQRAEDAKKLRDQLEAQCSTLSTTKAQLAETALTQPTSIESEMMPETETLPDSSQMNVRTNRIVPRMAASAETITPRPRGIPMKTERITRKPLPDARGT
jgi:chromosome segregation ATPase